MAACARPMAKGDADQVLERARCTLQCGGSRPLSRRNTLEARHALLLLEGGLAIEGET